jgi:deoxyribodipyrimidine photo-lyase
VPELERVPKKFIHEPWEATESELKRWNVTLGKTYPSPVISHSEGRQRALDALQEMKERNSGG